jgi:arylsulfatase
MDDGWVRGPMRRMVMAFEQSLREHPPIAPGAPDGLVPASVSARAAAKAG